MKRLLNISYKVQDTDKSNEQRTDKAKDKTRISILDGSLTVKEHHDVINDFIHKTISSEEVNWKFEKIKEKPWETSSLKCLLLVE